MIEQGWARTWVNSQVGRVKRLFKWSVAHELVPATVYHALATVDGLRRGRSEARETEDVTPVPEAHIEAVRPWLSQPVGALIDLQLLTGTRPGELLQLRPCDVDRASNVWTYRRADHKTAHHGHARVIYFGPRAQAILKRFFDRPPHVPMFSPREANAEQHAKGTRGRRRPNQKPSTRLTNRRIRDTYDRDSFRRAIHRACDKAEIPRWSPGRLRHNAGTFVRKEFGLEAAQIILGHKRADVTQLYAEINAAKAVEIAAKIG